MLSIAEISQQLSGISSQSMGIKCNCLGIPRTRQWGIPELNGGVHGKINPINQRSSLSIAHPEFPSVVSDSHGSQKMCNLKKNGSIQCVHICYYLFQIYGSCKYIWESLEIANPQI